MRILMAGASGLIGRALRAQLAADGHDVRALVRRAATTEGEYTWEGRVGSVPAAAVTWADAIASLSGAPIAKLPWTRAYRRQIMSSRVDTAGALAQAILESERPPAVWVSASATGFYGDAGVATAGTGAHRRGKVAASPGSALDGCAGGTWPPASLTESSPSGGGFLAAVVRAWEAAALPAAAATRLVRARTGLVLAPDEGALKPLILTTKLGLGGRFGSGRQFWPWISLRDEVRAWAFALQNESIEGPVNLVGPAPATAGEISQALARALRRPCWLTVPAPLLRAALDGAAQDLLLASQPVRPCVLEASGFEFLDATAETAIRALINQHNHRPLA